MSIAPLTFSGISKYSQDFQTILQRVTTVASFPLEQLKNEQQDVATKRQLTNELNSAVKVFGQKLAALRDIAGNRAVGANSSNTSKLTINSVNTDTPTVYTVTEVSSIAAAASETSLLPYANSASTAVSATGSVKLTVGSTDYAIALDPAENNLVGLRDKINNLNAGVTASILTVSGNQNYLSVTATATGAKTLTLVDDPSGAATTLLSGTNQGSSLNFKLNGVTVTRPSNQVNDLIPGVSFTLKGTTTGTEAINITLASERFQLSTAISDFTDAYNTLQSKVGDQIGATAGLLTGDLLVREASDLLHRASGFGLTEGSVRNWSDLGIEFSQTGEISFDSAVFNALSDQGLRDSFSFFEDTTGLGSLTARTDSFTDSITGLAKIQLDQYDRTDTRLTEQIANTEEKVLLLRNSYLLKLQAADSLLGGLESQQNIIDASVQSLNLVLYGKNTG